MGPTPVALPIVWKGYCVNRRSYGFLCVLLEIPVFIFIAILIFIFNLSYAGPWLALPCRHGILTMSATLHDVCLLAFSSSFLEGRETAWISEAGPWPRIVSFCLRRLMFVMCYLYDAVLPATYLKAARLCWMAQASVRASFRLRQDAAPMLAESSALGATSRGAVPRMTTAQA